MLSVCSEAPVLGVDTAKSGVDVEWCAAAREHDIKKCIHSVLASGS